MTRTDKEHEANLLGALIIEPSQLTFASQVLSPESFFEPEHQAIYQALLELYHSSQPIDILTLVNKLRGMGKLELVGGAYYISNLTSRIGSAANAEAWCLIQKQAHIAHKLKELGTLLISRASDPTYDVLDLLDDTEIRIGKIREVKAITIDTIASIKKDIIRQNLIVLDSGTPAGTPTGYRDLDKLLGNLQDGRLYVIAARPAMGKSAFLVQLAKNMALSGSPVAIFSLEMTKQELAGRFMSGETYVDSSKITSLSCNRTDLERLTSHPTERFPVFIDDTPALSINEIKARSRSMKSKHGIRCVMVDYLQLISATGQTREQEISKISRELKALSKELGCPVIALSQLSRQCENRPDKRPLLSDLRESGAIEQDADSVWFLYRPVYYGLFTEGMEVAGRILPTTHDGWDLMVVDVAKSRGTKTGEVPLRFNGQFMLIKNQIL